MRRINITTLSVASLAASVVHFIAGALFSLIYAATLSACIFVVTTSAGLGVALLGRWALLGIPIPPIVAGARTTGDAMYDLFRLLSNVWLAAPIAGVALLSGVALWTEQMLLDQRYGRVRVAIYAAYAIAFVYVMTQLAPAGLFGLALAVLFSGTFIAGSLGFNPSALLESLGPAGPMAVSLALNVFSLAILTSLVVFAIGLFSPAFRKMVSASLRLPKVRTNATLSLRTGIARLPHTIAPMLLALGASIMMPIAWIGIGTFSFYAFFLQYPVVRELVAAFQEVFGDSLGLLLLVSTAAALVALVGLVASSALKLPRSIFVDWLIGITLHGLISYSLLLGVIGSDDNAQRDNAVFLAIVTLPFVLTALTQRNLVWRATVETAKRWRSSIQSKADREVGSLGPVLYLRAFKDDALSVSRRVSLVDLLMGQPQAKARFEEVIAKRAFGWRPIVALGNPHIPFQMSGALKRNVDNHDWQEEVRYWNTHASYVLMIANKTENIGWEVDLLRSTNKASRTIFVMTQPSRVREFFAAYALLDGDWERKLDKNTIIVFRDSRHIWTSITSRVRSISAYSIGLDIAIAAMEEEVRASPLYREAAQDGSLSIRVVEHCRANAFRDGMCKLFSAG